MPGVKDKRLNRLGAGVPLGCPPLSRTTAWQNPKTGQTIPQSCLRMPAPFAQGSYGGGRCGGAPSSHASPYGKGKGHTHPPCLPFLPKGRSHEVTEGIRSEFAKRASLVMLFLPLLGAECRAGKEGNFAPTGQRGRENRDIAELCSARTRLSLR